MVFGILSNKRINVVIPVKLNITTMYVFIGNVLNERLDAKSDKINFDFSRLEFIDPTGMTVLCNLIGFLYKSRVSVSFSGANPMKNGAVKYLDDSGFFKKYTGKSLSESPRARDSTFPLTTISHAESYSWINDQLIPWISFCKGSAESSFSSIKVCFQEIFNNINDHSTTDIGCICGQYFPNKHEIEICISDFGVGIPYNVRKFSPGLPDHLAISKAMEEGFTTKTKQKNAGAGLDILSRSVVLANKGVLWVSSLKGMVTCTSDSEKIKKTARTVNGFYPGTLIKMRISTDFIQPDDDYIEVFEW
ncbi:hypothetical protein [Methylocaldum sp.]|uniref:hypothetical protein n=1 Tax=Methylocaldum sp. TaxID=1969727 RepID=UPI002D4FC40A|nr:hypothetical protein [Methylocaldum sp.]HYE35392.1 hypothetical protein [Methylocaldum sp.]